MESQLLHGYLALSAIIFAIGGAGILIRRSPLAILMCVELMWTAAGLAFIAYARQWGNMDGHFFAFFIITVAAAEVAIGLALIVAIFRRRPQVDIDDASLLRG